MRRAACAAALGASMWLLAQLLGVPTLLVPAAALLFAAVAAALVVRLGSLRVHLEREPLVASTEEGSRVRLATAVSGPRALRRSGEFAATAEMQPRPRRWLDGERVQFVSTPRRRGMHEVAPSLLRFRDPFGLCERTIRSPPTTLLVLPRIERVPPAQLQRLARSGPRARARAGVSEEVDGLRPVASYATAARIHWPSYARTGTLMQRQLRLESDSRPLLVLDGHDPAGADAFDMGVRAIASLAVALARGGGCSLLLAPEQRAHRMDAALLTWPRIHAQLALLEPSDAIAWELVRQAALVIRVSASTRPRPLHLAAGAGCVEVSPFPRADREVLFSVCGCAVQRGSAVRMAEAR